MISAKNGEKKQTSGACVTRLSAPLKKSSRSIFTQAAGADSQAGSGTARASSQFTKRHPLPQYCICLLYNTMNDEFHLGV